MNRPSRKLESRSGASRKSSALRDGGVSTTIRSQRPVRCARPCRAGRASPSPCTPACPRTSSRRRCRRGCPGSARPSPGWPGSRTTSSKVRFMSSIIASREPPPVPVADPGHRARGVVEASIPIDWASRRAGSMVSTTTLRPRSAARSASAADVVVLPTPPEPQHTMMPRLGVVEQGVDVEDQLGVVGGDQRPDAGAGPAALVGGGLRRSSRVPPRAAPRRARRARRGRRRRAAAAARTSARRARSTSARWLSSSCARSAWSRPSSSRPSTSSSSAATPAFSRLAASSPRSTVPSISAGALLGVEVLRADHVDDDARRRAGRRRAARRSRRRSPGPASPRAR